MVRSAIGAACVVVLMSMASCVPTSKYQEQQKASSNKQKTIESQQVQIEQLKKNIAQLKADMVAMQKSNDNLTADTTLAGVRNRTLSNRLSVLENDLRTLAAKMGDVPEYRSLMQHLGQMQDELTDSQDKLLDSEKAVEAQRKRLQEANDALQQSQEQLRQSSDNLEKKNKQIADQQIEIATARRDIEMQAARLREMEAALRQKDSAMVQLRNSIAGALRGFNPDELTVVHRDGKVYVSLEEKLLFASGKYDVNEKGRNAISKIAQVLTTTDEQIEINVEGHTDNVPLRGDIIADNWDLSVKRATSVVRILVSGGLPATRLQAVGRADTMPIASNDTDDGRRRNRRTEIILSPKIDYLLSKVAQ